MPYGAYVADHHIILKLGEGEQMVCRCDEVYIPGPHNLENALAAAVITGVMGVPCETMREVLKTFKGVEHRIETVPGAGRRDMDQRFQGNERRFYTEGHRDDEKADGAHSRRQRQESVV